MNPYLHIKSFLGQEKTIECLGEWSSLSCKDKVKDIKNWLKNKSLLSIDQKKAQWPLPAPNQLQKCPKTSPMDLRRSREVPRTIKEREKAKLIGKDLTHRGTGPPNWSLQPWTMSSIWPELS
ncbi:hypothetical protein O181_117796 [Austropuccinia psidii MF-1]|uniref:Uncharacterized protein n=1 Tax=Austropuccinia psidii MF-1 TaxID=1389203 RepID=A0A9Q3KDC9_9BASI|nr:hypothetical protein [Austropuccinia psidii MF-1]